MLLVTGSYSDASNPGIHLHQWNTTSNSFLPISNIEGVENPSYLTVDNAKGIIYAITEQKESSFSLLHIFELRTIDMPAELVGSIPFKGAGSCFVSTDSNSQHAFIANYGEGSLTVIALPAENNSGAVVQQLFFSGTGPNLERQDQPHIHAARLSNDEKFLLCADLGTDRVYIFSYRPDCGQPLKTVIPDYRQLPPGSGPRQLTFSPDGRWLYVITELSGEVFVFDASDPAGDCLQKVDVAQEGYCGKIEGGDIQVDPTGRFLYASNRGNANEIVVFKIDGHCGTLEFLQRTGAAGLSPRSLLICQHLGLLLVANEQSDNVSIFDIKENGTLQFTKNSLLLPAPTCLKEMDERSQ